MLMDLFLSTLDRETERLHKNKVRLRVIGDRAAFSPQLQDKIAASERLTIENDRMDLIIAANYGGRWDIVNAVRRIADQIERGERKGLEISEELLGSHLSTADLPEPDLFIRTGGEQRVSNFLLWQLAYTELFFTPTLWPDFDENLLDQAFADFSSRHRRFGGTGEQVEAFSVQTTSR